MKVYLPIICYNRMVHSHFMMSVMETIFNTQKKGVSFLIDNIYFESLIARARNAVASNFINKTNCDYMMFIDSDISFTADDFLKLLESDKPLISGLYPKKYISTSKVKALAAKSTITNNFEELCTDFATEIRFKKDLKNVEEVKYAATGFMLIKREVFNQIKNKFPEVTYKNDIDGYSEYGEDQYDFFPCQVNSETKKYESEDYGFCNLYRKAGGTIYVRTDCNLTHYGWKGYRGNMLEQNKIFT